ncbi:Long-chain-fatty-acid--CoA ligase [compost metagenome]
MFRAATRRTPEAVAIHYFDAAPTYAELDQLSDAFAALLLEHGFVPGERVAIQLQNMPHFHIAMLGAWKAGGIVVPINVMNRERELALLLDDVEPHTLVMLPERHPDLCAALGEGAFRPRLLLGASPFDFQTRNDARVLPNSLPRTAEDLPDLLGELGRHRGTALPLHSPAADDLAYIVYTSGTSGVPKGAQILQRNVVAGVGLLRRAGNTPSGVRVLGMAPLFHVTGLTMQVNLCLCMSGSLILTYRFDPAVMVDAVREHSATHVSGAATAYIAMMNVPGASAADMASISVAGSGGAPTPPALVSLAESFLGAPIQIGYGLTETFIASHRTPQGVPIPVDPASGALSIGPVTPGMTAWIENDAGQPAAVGEPGEIVISGPTLANGYWHKPTESAEAFRADGFRTGDIGIRDENGWYYIVDRKKDMISASGFKVWPREVEDVLYAHPAVREAAVVGVPDPYRGETVRAVVSLRSGVSALPDDLLAHCRTHLAAYKCPRELRFLDELPKTASGKILRRELRDA